MEFNLYNLQGMLQDYLFRTGLRPKFRSLSLCGKGVIPVKGEKSAIYVLKTEDGKDATFFGHQTCKNAWACPVCSVKRMHRHSIRIAAAIDALHEHGQVPIMITFTVLHNRFMSCKETTDILYTAWKLFIHRGNKKTAHRNDIYSAFREDCGSTHQVRVAEVTYGEHGWHPHFHVLFWVNKFRVGVASKYETKLRARWDECIKQATLKIWKIVRPELSSEAATNKLSKLMRHANPESKSLYMSRTPTGQVLVQQSSNYVCGWTADKELTGSGLKTARAGHYTPMQILENAYRLPAGRERDRWLSLYAELLFAVTGSSFHARINYSSHSGLSGIINDQLKHGDYAHCKNKKTWCVVCTLTPSQWEKITYLNSCSIPVKQHILELAMLPNPKDLINFYLSLYDIQPVVKCHNLEKVVESLFNAA